MLRGDSIENGVNSGSTGEASVTPESGTTPSHNGDIMPQDEELELESPPVLTGENTIRSTGDSQRKSLQEEVQDLKQNFVFISHQMKLIMKALHVNACPCSMCKDNSGVCEKQKSTDQEFSIFGNGLTMPQHSGNSYGQLPGGGKLSVTFDKRHVAEYAKVHGGLAAARKFGVAPPVASYYTKKDSTASQPAPVTSSHSNPNSSPGPSSEGEAEMSVLSKDDSQSASVPATPTINPKLPVMADLMKLNSSYTNPAHTGSPGFLRGRGRGRPKLIGDELDADLVEYMVQVKASDPHGHLSASQALQISKEYIMEKAPGLLEEHGGHVKLKLTWAMKLVNRIAERQKEMEMGLPPGTLQNMGRSLSQLGNSANNMMADMVAQNIFNQQMIKDAQMTGVTGASATPEILNVRELNLNFDANGSLNLGCIDDGVTVEESSAPTEDQINQDLIKKILGQMTEDESKPIL